MVEAIYVSLNDAERPTVIGKPNAYAWELIRREHGVSNEAVMLGDRLDTDMLFGNRAGLATCLVLTGVVRSIEEAALSCGTEQEPTFVIKALDLNYF
jgi:ribonucleotide monophosphatase NagD (HAD superfamily)